MADKWYELWDRESANLVAHFDSWESMIARLRQAQINHDPSWFDSLVLAEEHGDETIEPVIIAEGGEILMVGRVAGGHRAS